MPRIIALITAIAGLMWALNSLQRSGFSLSSLNPFHWYRRYQWNKKYGQNPLYTLKNPIGVAAVALLGIAKLEGEISKEQKNEIIKIFSVEFNLGDDDAKALFVSTAHLLQAEHHLLANIDKVFSLSAKQFSKEQASSTLALMSQIAKIESTISTDQQNLINAVESLLSHANTDQGKWG